MRFRDYIKERDLFTPTDREIEDARKALAKKEKINPRNLQYRFVQDWRPYKKRIDLAFDVMDKNHPRYKSTIHFQVFPNWGSLT